MPNEQYAVMPLSDYEDACDAIRAGTGKQALILSGEMAAEIGSISGGGATGYELLASGSYTYTGDIATQIDFPVSYSGTAVYAYAVADTILPGVNQSYCFFTALADLPFLPFFPSNKWFGMGSGADTSGAVSVIGYNDSNRIINNRFYLNRLNNTYRIQPNTYHWFIYGEAAT